MDAQELRNLQEAYMEVVENQQLDEEITPERRAKYKRGLKVRQANQEISSKAGAPKRATPPQPGAQHYRKGMTQSHRDAMRDAARDEYPERPEGSGSLPKGKKLERQKKTGVSAESYDIYDIILSHLLDEGYAETPEAAEVIMVNMSEEWRDSIVEEFEELDEEKKPLPVDRMLGQMYAHGAKAFAHGAKHPDTKNFSRGMRYHTRLNRMSDTLSGKRGPQVSRGKYAERAEKEKKEKKEKESNRFPNRLTRSDRQGIKDSYEYDIKD